MPALKILKRLIGRGLVFLPFAALAGTGAALYWGLPDDRRVSFPFPDVAQNTSLESVSYDFLDRVRDSRFTRLGPLSPDESSPDAARGKTAGPLPPAPPVVLPLVYADGQNRQNSL